MTGTALVTSFQTLASREIESCSAATADTAAVAARKDMIESLLRCAAMPVLVHAEAVAEWVAINDAQAAVCAQAEHKPQGGRPRGGVAEAARKLPLPKYLSDSARRQLVQRRLRIARISPRAKEEARNQKLDDNQTALLAIASEKTESAQVAVARTWRFRNGASSAPPQLESYTISGVENLNTQDRQKLDRVVRLISSRFRVPIMHTSPTPPDQPGETP